MVKVKICGLTTERDIQLVNKYCPDYVGFVFAKSRRQVTPLLVKELTRKLSPTIYKVGVFVNEKAETVNEISKMCDLDIVQLHGDETPYYHKRIHTPAWKAIRIHNTDSVKTYQDYEVERFVLDTYNKNHYGGTGVAFDWHLAADMQCKGKIILAGGLNAENVADAIDIINPYCVDVSSGVETNGIKDEDKIKRFIQVVRRSFESTINS